jgi:uncharacterized protein YjbI with pentapeptide repeats
MEDKDIMMNHPKLTLTVSMVALAIAAGPLQAQNVGNNPFKAITPDAQPAQRAAVPVGDNLGDHIATRVLNMNGYNITNLKDPFFEGDAVTLDYFNKNNGWDQNATGDIDMSGFTLKNLGSLDMQGGLILDSALDDAKIVNSTLTNTIITKSTIDNSELTNLQVVGGKAEDFVLSNPEISGGTARGLTLSDATIENPTFSNGVLTGSELIDATLDAPILQYPTINGGVLSQTATVDATHKNSTFQGETVIKGQVNLSDNRITGAGDAAEDSDVMNLRSTKALIEEFMAGMETTQSVELSVEDAPADEPMVEVPVDTAVVIDEERVLSIVEKYMSGLEIPAAADPAAVELAQSMDGLFNAGVARVTATDSGAKVAGDLNVRGHLTIEGTLDGIAAMYRPTPDRMASLGLLDGADATSALSDIATIVYNLPDGDLAMGIDPGTIPAEMSFVMKGGVDADDVESKSIDYVQMIAPMISAIQSMDARITELEAQISPAK